MVVVIAASRAGAKLEPLRFSFLLEGRRGASGEGTEFFPDNREKFPIVDGRSPRKQAHSQVARTVLGVGRTMRDLVCIALVGASIAVATTAWAQMGPPPPSASTEPVPARRMSLDEARAFARSHHLRLVAARQRLVATQHDADVPGAQWLPRIGGMAQIVGSTANNSTTTILGTSAVDLPRIGGTRMDPNPDLQPYPSTAVALGVRQQLFDFGRVAAERNAALLAGEVERFRVAGTALDVDFGVEQSFFAVLAAIAIEEASRGAYDRASQHRDLARANVNSGMRPPIELTRAEADAARYEAGLMRARAGVHVARSVFAVAVGIDDVELDAAGSPSELTTLPPLATLLGKAATAPNVLEGRARVEAQRAATKALDAQTRPNVTATASLSGRAGGAPPTTGSLPAGEGWIPGVPNYNVGVVFTWPILEPIWDRRADASRAREQAFASEAEAGLRSQRGAISMAYQDAVVSQQTLGALQRGADAGRANYDQAENRFRVGLGTSTELADAQALRTESDIQLAIGRFQVARTRAALERAIAEAR
jgi:outer membrane protein TolC